MGGHFKKDTKLDGGPFQKGFLNGGGPEGHFKNSFKMPPSQGAAVPWVAAEGGVWGIFQIVF